MIFLYYLRMISLLCCLFVCLYICIPVSFQLSVYLSILTASLSVCYIVYKRFCLKLCNAVGSETNWPAHSLFTSLRPPPPPPPSPSLLHITLLPTHPSLPPSRISPPSSALPPSPIISTCFLSSPGVMNHGHRPPEVPASFLCEAADQTRGCSICPTPTPPPPAPAPATRLN
jgi:hypothetical protein